MKKITSLALIAVGLLSLNACKKDKEVTNTYALEANSTATWKGSQRTGYFNNGTIKVISNDIKVINGDFKGGTINMPLSSLIALTEVLNDAQRTALVEHLKTPDFFNIALNPTLSYKIVSATKIQPAPAVGQANYQVKGELTLVGRTFEQNFPALITFGNNNFNLKANFSVDRLKWGITYDSDPSKPDTEYILPNMDIGLDISATKQ